MAEKTIYLVRHGRTEWNTEKRMQGQMDSPLTEEGHLHAEQSGQFLAEQGIEHIFASPLGRVQQTLDHVRRHVDAPVTVDDRLMEWHCGDWSGTLYDDLSTHWPDEWMAWEKDRYGYRPPAAENYDDMIDRCAPALEAILAAEASTIAVLSHGLLNRALALQLLGLSASEVLRVRQHNDVIFRIQVGETCSAEHFVAGEGPYPGLPMASR
ncbi:histidine phosphatase family protein [Parvularcula sp. LCG005]|uniref:histidine phosphatase family protein n=1 Tax=Parvularcula sp. LCG005 TaxID=3078805 RepID=UPI0029426DEE|nr:histidine phosphatase family protein [Parvularcula sp. LCG005]WOI53354.1 histidine phosphatase family protein [Parvularcula sp. LCG005]